MDSSAQRGQQQNVEVVPASKPYAPRNCIDRTSDYDHCEASVTGEGTRPFTTRCWGSLDRNADRPRFDHRTRVRSRRPEIG